MKILQILEKEVIFRDLRQNINILDFRIQTV